MKRSEVYGELIDCKNRLKIAIDRFMAEKDYEKCKPLVKEIDELKIRINELNKILKEF